MLYLPDYLDRLQGAVQAALPLWGLPDDSRVALLTVSENATFAVTLPDGGRRVLRVYRPGYHARDELLGELAWIRALRAGGVVDTPDVYPGRDGSPLQQITVDAETRHIACFQHVDGAEPAGDGSALFAQLGKVAARLHLHSRDFALPNGARRKRWNYDGIIGPGAYWGDWRVHPDLTADGRALLERVDLRLRDRLAAFGEGADRFGLIHCDMRAANLIAQGDRIWVIDFDDCGLSWFGYDFAASVSFIEHDPALSALRDAWIAGYDSITPLDPETRGMLGDFVMLRRMQLTAWLASHSETPTAAQVGPGYADGTVALARDWLGDA